MERERPCDTGLGTAAFGRRGREAGYISQWQSVSGELITVLPSTALITSKPSKMKVFLN